MDHPETDGSALVLKAAKCQYSSGWMEGLGNNVTGSDDNNRRQIGVEIRTGDGESCSDRLRRTRFNASHSTAAL